MKNDKLILKITSEKETTIQNLIKYLDEQYIVIPTSKFIQSETCGYVMFLQIVLPASNENHSTEKP
jgi:hypothetical protein